MKNLQNYINIKNELDILYLRKDTIETELKCLNENIKIKEQNKKKIEYLLKELIGVENKLYYQIIVKGLNVTKAVDKVSLETGLDTSTIWKNYYPKIKEKIKKSSENPVSQSI